MKNITRFVSILLCLLLGASTISCGFGDISDPLAENPELMNDAINNWLPLMPEEEAEELTGLKGRKAYHDGCIYYIDQYSTKVKPGMKPKWYTLFRYDMNTGVTSLACRDAACPHNDEFCPFFFQDTSIIKFQIVNDSLYFLTATYKTLYCLFVP